jgi:pimeloyl-ACP methyl ester carboxylesterase
MTKALTVHHSLFTVHPMAPVSYHLDTIAAENPVGCPVLCLPGLFAGSWVFERLLPLIAMRGYPAYAMSYRGHPPLAPMSSIGQQSILDFVADASAAAQSLDRPIVIAHSLGGLVAQLLAQRDLIRAAVLVSPAPPHGINVLSPAILVRMVQYLPALLFSRAFLPTNGHFDALVLNRVPDADRAAVRDRFVPDSGRAARDIALGVHKIPPSAIRVPLLVVGSEHDRFIPLGVARRVAERYGAPLHIAQGHGHFLLSEPGWESEATFILDWIDGLPSDVRAPAARTRVFSPSENRAADARISPSPNNRPATGQT